MNNQHILIANPYNKDMFKAKRTLIIILALTSIAFAMLYPVLSNLFGWSNLQITAFALATASIFFASMLGTTLALSNLLHDMPRRAKTITNVKPTIQNDSAQLLDSATNYIILSDKARTLIDEWEENDFNQIQLASFADDIRAASQKILSWWFDPVAIHHSFKTPAQRSLADTLCQAWIALLQQVNDPTSHVELIDIEMIAPLTTIVSTENAELSA
jgi:hypothetical protein